MVPLRLSLPSHRGIVALTGSRRLREDKRTDSVQAPNGPARTTGAQRKPARGCRHFREGGPAHSGPGTRPRPASGSEGPETASKRRSRACWELPNLRPEGLLSCFVRARTLPRAGGPARPLWPEFQRLQPVYYVAPSRLLRFSCVLREKSGQDTVGDTLQPSSWDSRNFMAVGDRVGDRATPRLRHGLAVPPTPIPQAALFILLYSWPLWCSDGKGSVCNAGDLGLIPG